MNVEVVREVQKLILKYPRNVNMDTLEHETAKCGSVGCVIFWTCLANGQEPDWNKAAKLLGFGPSHDDVRSHWVFEPRRWPLEWETKLSVAETPEMYAQVVVDYLDHCVELFT